MFSCHNEVEGFNMVTELMCWVSIESQIRLTVQTLPLCKKILVSIIQNYATANDPVKVSEEVCIVQGT